MYNSLIYSVIIFWSIFFKKYSVGARTLMNKISCYETRFVKRFSAFVLSSPLPANAEKRHRRTVFSTLVRFQNQMAKHTSRTNFIFRTSAPLCVKANFSVDWTSQWESAPLIRSSKQLKIIPSKSHRAIVKRKKQQCNQ